MITNQITRSRFRFRFNFFLLVVALNVIRPWNYCISSSSSSKSCLFTDAYRVGDVVDAAVSIRSALTVDLLMANQPQFGMKKTIHLPRLPERFSLSFEEGLHSLPYVDGQSLEQLIVTFVYTKSGGGRIHSVTSKAVRSQRKFDPKRQIEVLFDWVEEEDVDIEAGATVMFACAFVVSLLFMLQLCMIEGDGENDDNESNKYSYYKGR